jgi:hypothetical protein
VTEAHFAMSSITLVPIADARPLISSLVWRPTAVGPRLRAFVRTAEDVLRGHAPGTCQREPQPRYQARQLRPRPEGLSPGPPPDR